MATKGWERDPGVGHALAQTPQEFRFFQAVRLIRLFGRGGGGPYGGRTLQFRTRLSLEFPASEIYDLLFDDPAQAGPSEDPQRQSTSPLSMFVTFMGLTGPSGVLPYHYTELLLQRRLLLRQQGSKEGDDSAHAFFDLFSHRLIELFYEGWQKYRFYLSFERGEPGHLAQHLLDLVGMGTRSLRGRLNSDGKGVPDAMLGYYAGVLGGGTRSAQTLAAVTQDYFGVTTSVSQLRTRWLPIPTDCQSKLGLASSTLGSDLVLGDKSWDAQSLCRVELGPMTVSIYQSFLPDGKAYSALCRFLRWYFGWALDVEVLLKLAGQDSFGKSQDLRGAAQEGWTDVPLPRLGDPREGIRLGWLGWLGGRIQGESADGCCLALQREEI